jgi:hypothetical protein
MGNLGTHQDVKEQNFLFEMVKLRLHYSPSFKSFHIYSFICVFY